MSAAELKRDKRRVRRAVLEARDGLAPADRHRSAAAIADRFLALPEVESATAVMLFWSFGSELETAPLIERLHDRGATVALPRIQQRELVPVRYVPGDPTTSTSFGTREPAGPGVLDPRELDVVAVPAVAVDRGGRRIGYGGGFYDRFLPGTPAARIVPVFGIQLVDEVLPSGPGDVGVDAIVTERETIRVST